MNFKSNLEKSVKTATKTHIFFDKEKIEEKLKNKELPSALGFTKWSVFLGFFHHNAFFSPILAIRPDLLTSLKFQFNIYSFALYAAVEEVFGRFRYQIPTRLLVILPEGGDMYRLCSTGTLPLIMRWNFLLLSLKFTAYHSATWREKRANYSHAAEDFFRMLAVPQPVKKFPADYGKWKFTIALTNKTNSIIIITFNAGKFPTINFGNIGFWKKEKKSQGQTQINFIFEIWYIC